MLHRYQSAPNVARNGPAGGAGPGLATTVIANDGKVRHTMPAIPAMGSAGEDFLSPITPKGIEAAERQGSKRDNRLSVSVRIRPLNRADGGITDASIKREGEIGIVHTRPGGNDPMKFAFDNVFDGGQDEVYDCIGKPLLQSAFEGYNVTLFAYGQTGSGKTHSITGPDVLRSPEDEGFVPRFMKGVLGYAQVKLSAEPSLTVRLTMSMVEVYNEEIRDLLEKKQPGQKDLSELELREDRNRHIYIEGVSLHTILSYSRAAELIQKGFENRKVAATSMNERSSRSHSIISLHLLQKHEPGGPGKRDLESTIYIVDLAGSERQSKTGATGEQAIQAKNINLSLMTLGKVLNCLSEGKGVPPLRDSKLTRILSDSFGGNARTWMLACISASSYNWQESLSTLSYAASAKKIVNKAHVNAMLQRAEDREKVRQLQLELAERMKEIQDLRDEVERLKASAEGREIRRQKADDFGTVVGCGGNVFIGRAKLSLRNCVLQFSSYNTLPLVVQKEEHDGATLTVNSWPASEDGREITEYSDLEAACQALRGKRFDCCINVISADGIPAEYSKRIFCRYVFTKKEQKPMTTEEVHNTTSPKWDFRKRFAWSAFDDELGRYLCSDVVTFEVIGYPA
eukprot:GGOE01004349.1.p1 GENE.GGOE01004349.1~~GGOE01004349.1.p1  ORF type:complete len:627 (-),score=243.39 GGOE01004349.1:570-2450(-)